MKKLKKQLSGEWVPPSDIYGATTCPCKIAAKLVHKNVVSYTKKTATGNRNTFDIVNYEIQHLWPEKTRTFSSYLIRIFYDSCPSFYFEVFQFLFLKFFTLFLKPIRRWKMSNDY